MSRTMTESNMMADFRTKPYMRVLVPEDDGSYRAEIYEFPGCIAVGDTVAEALSSLEEVAQSWIKSEQARGNRIPEPLEDNEYSGKLVLRMPRSLHRRAAIAAEYEKVSMNQLIVTAVASYLGGLQLTSEPTWHIHGLTAVFPSNSFALGGSYAPPIRLVVGSAPPEATETKMKVAEYG